MSEEVIVKVGLIKFPVIKPVMSMGHRQEVLIGTAATYCEASKVAGGDVHWVGAKKQWVKYVKGIPVR